ncbi:unnamed protein product [Symbiodinium natans]|uniref:tRNAHis guanylyltransferase catalytic domain-containing protein n=1 Tax=Symbiodinium natans TaxID=878477 RepID=A0A812HUL1_9DINO|nr:unnamed protein product [Symbiodinium natans]
MAGRARLGTGICLCGLGIALVLALRLHRSLAFAHEAPGIWQRTVVRRARTRVGVTSGVSGTQEGSSDAEPSEPSELAREYEQIWDLLKHRTPASAEDVPAELHQLAAPTPRAAWQELGQLVTAFERPASLNGSKWVTIRLDGCMFGTLTKRMRDAGLIGPGYSDEIGEAMQLCCRAMLDEFKGNVAYTHSDEMTILLCPRQTTKAGAARDWPHGGRVQKWLSIGASIVTALFNRKLEQMAEKRGMQLPHDIIAHFDCRLGEFDSLQEALALLLWRSFDCSVNCLQDGAHHAGAPLEVVQSDFSQKLRWLHKAGLLPLKPHQAYGSLFVKTIGEFDTIVPGTNETVRVSRKVNVKVNDGAHGPQNLLLLPKYGMSLIPSDGDPRLELRNGSYWRYAGPSGTGQESNREDDARQDKRRKRTWKRAGRRGGPRRS